MSFLLNDFERAEVLEAALSDRLIDALAAAIDARGEAILAVSGGRTPAGLFKCLSGRAAGFLKGDDHADRRALRAVGPS